MIEIIYKEEKQEAKGNEVMFGIPRNIRQIGLADKNFRIYIEDYVYTFLGRKAGASDGQSVLAVLTGEMKWADGVTYLFAKGAILAEDTEAAPDHIDFGESLWQKIGEEKEKYFPEQEIVGWFFASPQLALEMTEVFTKTHLKHFGGEKVLLLMDPTEREDAFFRYENNLMVRQSGYYIYYEKNPQMQTYIVEKNGEIPMEQNEDRAVESFRKIIKGKKKETYKETHKAAQKEKQEEPQEGASVFSYAATACLAIAVLTVGVNFYQNYRDMQSLDRQTAQVAAELAANTASDGKTSGGNETDTKNAEEKTQEKAQEASSAEIETEGTVDQEMDPSSFEAEDLDFASSIWQAGSVQPTVTPEEQEEARGADEGKIKTEEASGEVTEESAGTDVYQEESDVRKANRRIAQDEAQTGQTVEKTAEETVEETAQAGKAAGTSETGQENSQKEPGEAVQKAAGSGQASEGEAQETEEQETAAGVHESYVIRPGDTLYYISLAKYGNMDAIQEICKLNNMSADEVIYPGQVIMLP